MLLEYWNRRKEAEDWKISTDLISIQRSSHFFSFDGSLKKRHPNELKKGLPQSIYHMLTCYDVEEVADMTQSIKNMQRMRRNFKQK